MSTALVPTQFSKSNVPVKASGKQLSLFDLKQAYVNYKATYDKVTGQSWSEERFISRGKNWIFYGTSGAYVAVRPQGSGALKLCTMAGDPNDATASNKIKAALMELLNERKPTWGLVSKQIATVAARAGFITLPPSLVIDMFAKRGDIPEIVPGYVLVDAQSAYKVNSNGTISVHDAELGSFEPKHVIVNDLWIKYSADLIIQRLNSINMRMSSGDPAQDAASYNEKSLCNGVLQQLSQLIGGKPMVAAPVKQLTAQSESKFVKPMRRLFENKFMPTTRKEQELADVVQEFDLDFRKAFAPVKNIVTYVFAFYGHTPDMKRLQQLLWTFDRKAQCTIDLRVQAVMIYMNPYENGSADLYIKYK